MQSNLSTTATFGQTFWSLIPSLWRGGRYGEVINLRTRMSEWEVGTRKHGRCGEVADWKTYQLIIFSLY